MKFNNIIFDFDGTLIDSRPGVVKSFKKIVKKLTNKEIKEQRIIKLIGLPLTQILTILLETDNKIIIDKGIGLFQKYYSQEGIYENVFYPGIKEMLESLKSQSCQLFVVSNKIELFINKILEQRNIKEYFIFIVGTDGTDVRSKKADYIKYILTHYKLKKEKTIMVGDTENDIIAANGNSIYSIGITWGYGSKDSLIKAKADKICHTPIELQQFFIE